MTACASWAGTVVVWGTISEGAGSPSIELLKPRSPSPSDRPISGRRLAPNTSSRITSRNAMWIGLESPIGHLDRCMNVPSLLCPDGLLTTRRPARRISPPAGDRAPASERPERICVEMSLPADPLAALRQARRDPDLVLIEGFHALKHALRFGAEILRAAITDQDEMQALAAALAPDIPARLPADTLVV